MMNWQNLAVAAKWNDKTNAFLEAWYAPEYETPTQHSVRASVMAALLVIGFAAVVRLI